MVNKLLACIGSLLIAFSTSDQKSLIAYTRYSALKRLIVTALPSS